MTHSTTRRLFSVIAACSLMAWAGCASEGRPVRHATSTGGSGGPPADHSARARYRSSSQPTALHAEEAGSPSRGGPAARGVDESGGGAPPPPAPTGGSAAKREAPAPRGSGSRPRYRSHRGPAPRSPDGLVTRRPQPRERPGLGTRFGEQVSAPVRFTSFQRATTRPAGMVSIHYNDRKGLQAMAQYLQRRCCNAIPPYRVRAGITVQLVDARRRPLSGLQLHGRTLVLGRHNQRYGILVRNHTRRRWEIVASVDGLDVIDGRRASAHKRGYILGPHRTLYVQGFRTSARAVAAFRFGTVRNSYAKRSTGSSRNVGVVGVAAFAEHRPRWTRGEVEKRLRARPFGDTGYAQPPRR